MVVESEEGAYEYGVGAYANCRCGGYIVAVGSHQCTGNASRSRRSATMDCSNDLQNDEVANCAALLLPHMRCTTGRLR